jgi:hypothetical protein
LDRRGPRPLVNAVSMAGLLPSPETPQPPDLRGGTTAASPSAAQVDPRVVALVRALARQAAREAWAEARLDDGALSQASARLAPSGEGT